MTTTRSFTISSRLTACGAALLATTLIAMAGTVSGQQAKRPFGSDARPIRLTEPAGSTAAAGYGNNIVLHAADELVVHRSQDPRVVIIEYDVHGKTVATGSSYDNRFISVVTIEGRKIVQWWDYMDSLAAMIALSQVQ